jgi:hypothetical protein
VAKWSRIGAELTAYERSRQADFAGFDEAAVARFLGGQSPPEEAAAIGHARSENAAFREWLEVAEQVLAEPGLVPAQSPPATASGTVGPRVWDTICAWVDSAGRMVAEGFEAARLTPQFAGGELMGPGDAPREIAFWLFAGAAAGPALSIGLSGHRDAWLVRLELQQGGQRMTDSAARLELCHDDEGVELSGPLSAYTSQPLTLRPGRWTLRVWSEASVWQIPFDLRTLS